MGLKIDFSLEAQMDRKGYLSDEKSEGVRMKSRRGTDEKSEQNTNLLNNTSTKRNQKSLSKDKEAKASYKDIYNAEENKVIKNIAQTF